MRTLAVETLFAPYFETAVCEYDLLARLKPLREEWDRLADMAQTPEKQRSAEVRLSGVWRDLQSSMPESQRPPFAASRFAQTIRDELMDPQRLANMVAETVRWTCPGRIEHLGGSRAAREAALKHILTVVFRAIEQQGREEPTTPGTNTHKQEGPSMLFERLRQLPDLLTEAIARNTADRYAELERLKKEYDAAKKPYRFSMPYRNPGRLCKSGEHAIRNVKHTLVNPVRKQTAELWEAEWHEAEAHGTALPGAVVRFLEALAPTAPPTLSFGFNSVEFVKEGPAITLTLWPLWQDAQRPAPAGFEDDVRTFRMSEDAFAPFYAAIARLDLARYASLTEADFEPLPPDLRHFERLFYHTNGHKVVSWGREAWLKSTALRQPLLALEQQAQAWAQQHPEAERSRPPFERLVLRDVQGLEGGRNVYVRADGLVTVQVVTPTESGLAEKRYELKLSDTQRQALHTLLDQHPLAKARIPDRPGVPDQARPEITLQRSHASTTTVATWDDERQPDFDAIYAYLLELEKTAQKSKPIRQGAYVPEQRPE